jgi:hypothetical protein
MQKSTYWLIAVFACAALFWQCGQNPTSTEDAEEEPTTSTTTTTNEDQEPPSNPQDAMQEAMNQLQNLQNGETVEVVNFRDLKALLPETLIGLDRTSHTGEKAGAMGFSVSQAEASYGTGDKTLDVAIIDGGGIGMAQMGLAAWAMAEIDREDDNGWAKTTTIAGHKAYQEHNNNGTGQVSILVAGRGVINVDYEGVSEGEIEKVVKTLDISGLERLFAASN